MQILTNSNGPVRATESRWQQQMKLAIRSPERLARELDLPLDAICPRQANGCGKGSFPLFVPLPYLARIERGNPQDPLLLQVLPTHQENEMAPGFSEDPIDESSFLAATGLLHKYLGRALMIVSGTCAIHCRYCFRRHFPYSESSGLATGWQEAVDHLRADNSIREVILSGGDPLTVVDAQLEALIDRLESINHLRRLRVHTRLPVVIPQRITQQLVNRLTCSTLRTVFVIHCNHANEVDSEVAAAVNRLTGNSIPVLNQSVLLRGVNDSLAALTGLSERLIQIGVIPYYLHQLDPVAGAAHFQVPVERGLELVEQMRATLSGYLVPRYVQEIPGLQSKTKLA